MRVEIGLAFLLAVLATATASYGQVAPPGAARPSFGQVAPPGTIPGLFDPSTQTFTPFGAAAPPGVAYYDGTMQFAYAMTFNIEFRRKYNSWLVNGQGKVAPPPLPRGGNSPTATGRMFIPDHFVTFNDNFAVGDKNPTTTFNWAYQPSHPGDIWFGYTTTIYAYDEQGNYHSFSYTGAPGPMPKNGAIITIHGSL